MKHTKNTEDLIYVHKTIFNTLVHKLDYIINEDKDELTIFELEKYTNEYYFFVYMYDSLCEFESYLLRNGVDVITETIMNSFLEKTVDSYCVIDPDTEYDYYINMKKEM